MSSEALRLIRCIAAAAALLISPIALGVSVAEPSERYVKVTGLPVGQVLWVRAKASVTAKPIGFLPSTARHIRSFGCRPSVTGRWCRIRYRGTRGWAAERYLQRDYARRA